MKYLKLENHLIPVLNIARVSREFEDGTDDEGNEVQFVKTIIHMKSDSDVEVDEDFDVVCECLNPIKA